ncbi:MAG: 50S ribosomal protein L30 [Cyanobacteria bacterium]|jgi:large subunit ribosomal protein L30|nr:50S ribosomal protein L30 [Cyanobacteriota bacterium]
MSEDTTQQLKISLTKSLLGRPEKHRKVAKALGLTKTNDTKIHYGSATIRGMIRKISHLLTVEVA